MRAPARFAAARRPTRFTFATARRLTRFTFGALVIAAAAFGGRAAASHRAARLDASVTHFAPTDAGFALRMGEVATAPEVRIFGDYTCAACRRLERVLGDTLLALARAGDIRLIYHPVPLLGPRGELGVRAVSCAGGEEARWRMHRLLLDETVPWLGGADPSGVLAAAASIARPAAFRACVAGADSAAASSRAVLRAIGIHAVPAVFLDGRRVRYRGYGALLDVILRARPLRGRSEAVRAAFPPGRLIPVM